MNSGFKKYFSSKLFKLHFKKHKPKELKVLSTYITKGFSYKCYKCPKLMLCDKNFIQAHMFAAHNIKWKDTSTLLFSQIPNYKNISDFFKKRTPISSVVWETNVLPINQIPLNEVTSRIGNLCSFQCPKCNTNKFSSWYKLVQHCKKVHNYKVCYDYSLVSVATCHSCLLCPNAILSDRAFLCYHLQNVHKVSLTKYEQIYLQNGGEVLPTYRDWLKNGYNLKTVGV